MGLLTDHFAPLTCQSTAMRTVPMLLRLRTHTVSMSETVLSVHMESSSPFHLKANGLFGKDTATFLT